MKGQHFHTLVTLTKEHSGLKGNQLDSLSSSGSVSPICKASMENHKCISKYFVEILKINRKNIYLWMGGSPE